MQLMLSFRHDLCTWSVHSERIHYVIQEYVSRVYANKNLAHGDKNNAIIQYMLIRIRRNASLFHGNIQLLYAKETSKVTENGDCCQKKNSSQRLSLSGARISRPEQDFVGLFSVSAGVGAREVNAWRHWQSECSRTSLWDTGRRVICWIVGRVVRSEVDPIPT